MHKIKKRSTVNALLLTVLLSLLAGNVLAATRADLPATELNSGFTVINAAFGTFHTPENGEPAFSPSDVVPNKPDQGYGWLIEIRTKKSFIHLKEEFTLPVAPETWGDPEPIGKRTISDDGRTAITERELVVENGLITNTWAVAPGDPSGRYVIRIYIEEQFVREFVFEVR